MPSEAAAPERVRGLQERAARAQPAEHLERIGGWWLRHTGTSSWWIGTVLAHGEADDAELSRRIEVAERFYAGFEAPTAFQLTPGVCAGALDAMLGERGYGRSGSLSLMTAPADAVAARPSSLGVRLDDVPTAAWLDARGADGERVAEERMLARVASPTVYASVEEGGTTIAVGRAVLDSGWAGVFGMWTRPEARRIGVGRAVLAALALWAAERDAQGLYLQVEGDNVAALRLYEGAGFTEAARYHYRSQPPR